VLNAAFHTPYAPSRSHTISCILSSFKGSPGVPRCWVVALTNHLPVIWEGGKYFCFRVIFDFIPVAGREGTQPAMELGWENWPAPGPHSRLDLFHSICFGLNILCHSVSIEPREDVCSRSLAGCKLPHVQHQPTEKAGSTLSAGRFKWFHMGWSTPYFQKPEA